MAAKTPDAPPVEAPTPNAPAGEAPENQNGAAPLTADAFVKLADLDISRPKPNPYGPLLALVGEQIGFAAVRSADGKTGEADVYKVSDVVQNEDGTVTLPTTYTTVQLPKGALRVLAAAADKANGKIVTATVIKKKRGLGFE